MSDSTMPSTQRPRKYVKRHRRFKVVSNVDQGLTRELVVERLKDHPNVRLWFGIVHDRDPGRTTHTHVGIELKEARTTKAIEKMLGVPVQVLPYVGRRGDPTGWGEWVLYLLHWTQPHKAQYEMHEIFHASNFDPEAALAAYRGHNRTAENTLRRIQSRIDRGIITSEDQLYAACSTPFLHEHGRALVRRIEAVAAYESGRQRVANRDHETKARGLRRQAEALVERGVDTTEQLAQVHDVLTEMVTEARLAGLAESYEETADVLLTMAGAQLDEGRTRPAQAPTPVPAAPAPEPVPEPTPAPTGQHPVEPPRSRDRLAQEVLAAYDAPDEEDVAEQVVLFLEPNKAGFTEAEFQAEFDGTRLTEAGLRMALAAHEGTPDTAPTSARDQLAHDVLRTWEYVKERQVFNALVDLLPDVEEKAGFTTKQLRSEFDGEHFTMTGLRMAEAFYDGRRYTPTDTPDTAPATAGQTD